MKLFGTQAIQNNTLSIGNVLVTDLQQTYGTPLYIMDESHIRNQARCFLSAFRHPVIPTEVIYASKAFLTVAMCELIKQEGLSIDVVSGGELYTAVASGFPKENIYFHGNNKSLAELRYAIKEHVGVIVIDHEMEFERLVALIPEGRVQSVLLRINPGIEAHTHEFIKTTKNDSKFGLSIFDHATLTLVKALHEHPQIDFLGFHSHIGSQIFEEQSFIEHGEVVVDFIKTVYDQLGVVVKAMNLGGGFGVHYTDEDRPFELTQHLQSLLESIHQRLTHHGLPVLKVMIEPGRAIVANAGVTLYEVGYVKKTFAGKQYVFIDGAMNDHLRTALYGANYTALLANNMNAKSEAIYTITGKACESGDIIIKEAHLPTVQMGDLIAVQSTGAYHYSMASNYNRLTRPAVVFVKDGMARIVVKRETYADLMSKDCSIEEK